MFILNTHIMLFLAFLTISILIAYKYRRRAYSTINTHITRYNFKTNLKDVFNHCTNKSYKDLNYYTAHLTTCITITNQKLKEYDKKLCFKKNYNNILDGTINNLCVYESLVINPNAKIRFKRFVDKLTSFYYRRYFNGDVDIYFLNHEYDELLGGLKGCINDVNFNTIISDIKTGIDDINVIFNNKGDAYGVDVMNMLILNFYMRIYIVI